MAKCPICGGTGDTTNNIPPTNEQWFCTLSTEEKALTISRLTSAYGGNIYELEEWLKEKHYEE